MEPLVGYIMFFMFAFSGCIPRNTVVQPELLVQVLHEGQTYISNAQVLFVTFSDPHSNVHRYMSFYTDEKGLVYIPEQKEFEWIFPLMMHGIPFYRYHLCIYKDGYIPQYVEISQEESQNQNLIVTLLYEKDLNKDKILLYKSTIDPCAQYKDE